METLMKQIRLKCTGAEEENKTDLSSSIDQKIQSFKDKKKAQNWFQRQTSRNMSHDYDSTEMEHATSIAAAAFAIHSQEGVSEIPQKKKLSEHLETSLTKTKSKVKDTKSPFSQPGVASKRSVSFKFGNDQGKEEPTSSVIITEEKNPEKAITPEPSLKNTSSFGANSKYSDEIPTPKRTPSFGDNNLMNTIDDIKPETPPPFYQHVPLRPPPPPPIRQASTRPDPIRPPTPASGTRGQTLTRAGTFETKADAWERNELQKIKERYERLIVTIDSWEKRKKMKARSKLNKHEQSEDELKRVKAVKKYQNQMKYIDEIAEGARAESVERRRNEEFKVKEKANIIRTTGKLPRTCYCF
ncbi:putative remorin [Lupinus albus]|uniref:Putative remorin n=1 Tax=Lupinus albus TaxID=3870 RepID=A0A6A4P6G3_LUPAL|nr:putative remorin [Lupinus albus]